MWHKKDHNIPSFISIHAWILYASSSQMLEQSPLISTILGAYLVSLNIKLRLLSLALTYPIKDNR